MPELYDGRGQKVTLGARLGRGGEGEVFEVTGRSDLAAKLLYASGRTQAKLDKLDAMVARPPAGAHDALEGLPVLTWPRHVLHSKPTGQGRSTFVGYAMTRMAPRDFVPFYQLTSAARRSGLGGQPITWDRLVLLGMRLCHLARTLHRFGYAVGDLNDRNVLVSRRLTPLLMDTDSFQVPKPGTSWKGQGHFPSIVGDAQYWAPELLAVDLATYKGTREPGDRYALGVLLFQLFMGGLRPYQSRGALVDGLETLAEKTKAGHYPWASPKKGVLEPPASAPDYRALPKPIRQAFERCFVDGHGNPSKRPSADDWYAVLARVRDAGYQTCKAQVRHVFAANVAVCPWCLDPNDPFAGGPVQKGRLGRPSRRLAVQSKPAVLVEVAARRPVTKAPAKGKPKPGKPPQWTGAIPPAPQPVAKPKAAPAPVTRAKPRPRTARASSPARKQARRGKRPKRRKQSWRRIRRNATWVAYSALALATAALAWAAA
jgi:DNA-binding helix-hairpin-helix protein with protein kinase domain